MFSQVEESYVKSLISRYYEEGYTYYICHTVTESDNDYDIYIYFSKTEITAIDKLNFDLKDGLFIKIDSSSRNQNAYNPSTDYRIVLSDSRYNGVVSVDKAEFIYTNCKYNYESTVGVIYPDFNYSGSSFYVSKYSVIAIVVLVVSFVYTFVRDVLRIRK